MAVNFRSSREDADSAVRQIEEMGRRAVAVQGSTDSTSDVARFVGEAHEFLGGIDLLVNNAGILKRTALLDISEEEWDSILDVNLKGYFLVGQAVARGMVEDGTHGAIVNVSSAGQKVAAPNLTHYCVAKAGVEMLTKQMALELAPHKIRVNSIAPGLIETDLNRADIARDDFRERRLARIPGPPPIQWTDKCLSFSSVLHPRWSQKLPLRQRRRGVEGSRDPPRLEAPRQPEGPKGSRCLRVLHFEVDRRLVAQR